ncbi:MAG: rhomboid family intramembrane serine protease [Bacteroidales bacterium]|nr:rhomboid family intramembrane serine protease [Bacteroidales bacterium]
MNVIQKYWIKFKYGNYFTKILYINIAVYVIVSLFRVLLFLLKVDNQGLYYPLNYLMLPANIDAILQMPWTVITYMFTHEAILHIVFNMLWFYWFGKIFIDYLGSKKLLYTYLLGGIFGALFYIGAFNIFPVFHGILHNSRALGASAAVIAIVVTISFYIPNFSINLLFFGQVKLKYIAIVTIIIDFLSIASENSGGHIAHLGGAFYGIIYGLSLRSNSLHIPRLKVMKKKKKNRDVRYMTDEEYNYEKKQEQLEIDRILDKISKHGYQSLTDKEKETLFNSSKR